MDNIWLHRYAVLLAVCTLFLVVAGGMVTSNEAGLAVPDWPLSYGQLMPPMEGGVFYEHGHRMVATAVGLLTIGLVIWLFKSERRAWLKGLGAAALGAVILQGILGGITVLYHLPKAMSISHASLAQLFFSTTVAIALFTSRSWQRDYLEVEDTGSPSLRTLAIIVPVSVLCQLALGAAARHKAFDVIPHVIGAMVVSALVFMVGIAILTQYPKHPALSRTVRWLLGLTFFQVFLGIAAYMSRILTTEAPAPMPVMVGFTVAHVAVGALVMATSVMLAIQVFRNVRRTAQEPAASGLTTA